MPPRRAHPIAILLTCLVGTAVSPLAASAQAWSATASTGVTHNNNASNSAREEKSDTAVIARVDYGTHRLLARDWQGSLGLSASASHWFDYEGLDLAELNADLGLRHKFGLGPYAPRLDATLTVGRLLAQVDEWSGNHFRTGLTASQRLSPAWQFALGTELSRLDANRSVYSHTQWNATLKADYDPTPDWRLSLALRHRRGDQLSWCRNSWPSFVGTTQWLDGIFGGDWFPYRTQAHLNGANFTLSRALGAASSASLGVELTRSKSKAHKTYDNRIVTLQLTHAF